jgi:hypothetical protein
MITSSQLIKEVLDTPPQSLSLHAVAKEVRLSTYRHNWRSMINDLMTNKTK